MVERVNNFFLNNTIMVLKKSHILTKLVLNIQTNGTYTSSDRMFCLFNQPMLVMLSCGEPVLIALKVVTLQCQNAKTDPKKAFFGHFKKSQRVKFAKRFLEPTTGQHWNRLLCYFNWKTLFLPYFLEGVPKKIPFFSQSDWWTEIGFGAPCSII